MTVVGQFRGRNLFGDLPSSPGKSRYDFVLRSADAAIWVTEFRPRGRGFDFSVDARVDTGRWLQVSGTVTQERGLVTIIGSAIAEASAPEAPAEEEAAPPPVPVEPGEVVFSSPTEGEIGVPMDATVRLQFSRGLNPASIAAQLRASYVAGASGDAAGEALEIAHSYDAATRAVEIRFTRPLERFRTVKMCMRRYQNVRQRSSAPLDAHLRCSRLGFPASPERAPLKECFHLSTNLLNELRRGRHGVRPAVGIGVPIRTLTCTGRTMGLPFRMASRPPWTATGTIGACAWMAMMNPPFLNGSRSPVRLRVPSGKIRNELPARSDSRAVGDRRHAPCRGRRDRRRRTRRRRTRSP